MVMGWMMLTVVIGGLLALDLGVFNKKDHVIGFKEACLWSLFWIFMGLAFCFGIFIFDSRESAILFLTGYVVEKALSVDNLFLFLVAFNYFSIDRKYQHRVLFWGILGAIFTRGILIAAGVTLIHQFEWLIYVFGVFIIYTGIKTAITAQSEVDLEHNKVLLLVKRYIPIKVDYKGPAFFLKEGGKYIATPMFVVLLVLELTDILFALDSIPAILGITTDPFIVYSSNLFAILGLRALYFVLAGMMDMFEYLAYGVSAILVLVGLKMLTHSFVDLPEAYMLLAIAFILLVSILPSIPRLVRMRSSQNKD